MPLAYRTINGCVAAGLVMLALEQPFAAAAAADAAAGATVAAEAVAAEAVPAEAAPAEAAAGPAPAGSGSAGRRNGGSATDRAFAAYGAGRIAAAQRLYLDAARRGDALAAYNAALIRLRDEADVPPLGEALQLLRQAAEAGVRDAPRLLASLYEQGELLPAIPLLARLWYERAAEGGDVAAQVALATRLYVGGDGEPADPSAAAPWYRRAAEAGDVAAQYILGSMHEHGLGVPADTEQALAWYSRAGRQGDVVAELKAKELAARLARERAR